MEKKAPKSSPNNPSDESVTSSTESASPREEPATKGNGRGEAIALPQVFRLNKLAYFTVPAALIVSLILAGTSLPWLGWTLILPFALAWWIHRVCTTVTEDGLVVTRTFSTETIAWETIDGLQFPKWTAVRAVLIDGRRKRLPAITFQDLPRLSAASRGRIPDPYADAE